MLRYLGIFWIVVLISQRWFEFEDLWESYVAAGAAALFLALGQIVLELGKIRTALETTQPTQGTRHEH